jgi:hypothetical protein
MKKMIKIWIPILAIVCVSFGCEDLLKVVNINFNTDPQSAVFTINPADSGDYVDLIQVVTTDIKKQISDNGGSIDNLDKVKINSINVTIVSGADNFDAFKSFEIWVETDNTNSKKVAWKSEIPLGATLINPDFNTDNLKDIISQDQYNLLFKGSLRQNIESPVELKVEVVYSVQL